MPVNRSSAANNALNENNNSGAVVSASGSDRLLLISMLWNSLVLKQLDSNQAGNKLTPMMMKLVHTLRKI